MTIKKTFHPNDMNTTSLHFFADLSRARDLARTASTLLLRSGVLLEQVMHIAIDETASVHQIVANIQVLGRQIRARSGNDVTEQALLDGLGSALIDARLIAR
ncbi:hypothetical protein GTP81_08455 [Rugamonas sp. FT107W]|uniref:Uncharacterized protein n=1 Tax=Duganella vulcania TaxID=2692166 RepID=A0A845HC94_9BURK|nr:hypothetical protein [Duganella vulcania]MYN16782.1 hypothetical protein [Duganella vulcania]